MPLITLFSAPKPFTDPFIATIQRNAVCSWLALGQEVEVLLMGQEDGLAETAAQLGVRHLADIRRNTRGTPLVSSMFEAARQHSTAPLLCCINADILLLPDLLPAARAALEKEAAFLMVGQRWDLDVAGPLDFSPGWEERLRREARSRGSLHPPAGSDYFLFPRASFTRLPDFAIGRAGWDNWMIYAGRRQGIPVIDASGALQIIHQNHDYRHLPGGKPHYRMPESDENIRAAGGRRTIFTLADASLRMDADRQLRPVPRTVRRLLREAEIAPLVRLGSYPLGMLTYALFHPRKFYGELRGWLQYKISKNNRQGAKSAKKNKKIN